MVARVKFRLEFTFDILKLIAQWATWIKYKWFVGLVSNMLWLSVLAVFSYFLEHFVISRAKVDIVPVFNCWSSSAFGCHQECMFLEASVVHLQLVTCLILCFKYKPVINCGEWFGRQALFLYFFSVG